MSGRHAVVKPRNRALLTVTTPVVVCGRWIRFGAGWLAGLVVEVSDGFWAKIKARHVRRFGDSWAEPAAPALDPGPAPTPVEDVAPAPQPTPVSLSPEHAAQALHAEQKHLPWQLLEWHITDVVHGEVRSLDCGWDQMHAVVNQYAHVLGAVPVEREADGCHTVRAAVGEYAGVTFIISAVILTGDTVPLRVYAETKEDESLRDDTLTTQALPERVLAEVLGR